MATRRRNGGESVVRRTVAQLGGQLKAAAAGETTITTVRKSITDGRVRSSATVVRWANLLEPTDPKRWQLLVRQLAGLEP